MTKRRQSGTARSSPRGVAYLDRDLVRLLLAPRLALPVVHVHLDTTPKPFRMSETLQCQSLRPHSLMLQPPNLFPHPLIKRIHLAPDQIRRAPQRQPVRPRPYVQLGPQLGKRRLEEIRGILHILLVQEVRPRPGAPGEEE